MRHIKYMLSGIVVGLAALVVLLGIVAAVSTGLSGADSVAPGSPTYFVVIFGKGLLLVLVSAFLLLSLYDLGKFVCGDRE